jgi:thiosulfate/3-mercaptopyruvate sulfurtransferase
MPFTTLISTENLAGHLDDPAWAIVDCRFDLADTDWGEQQYLAGHLPGAAYAHLDRDLSGPKTGTNGRHPLPEIETFKARLGQWGIGPGVQVVAYDQDNGMYASRLWWLLRFLGHEAVAVLDGGVAKWRAEDRPLRAGPEAREPRTFVGEPRYEMRLTAADVEMWRKLPSRRLIDARAPERFRGETEPLDRVAGHIPGALNYFYKDNVNLNGTFLAPEKLRAQFQALLGDIAAENTAVYCGSGVSAAHDLLAMEVAGLRGEKLYAGSWSEWCSDPARPVETSVR